MVELLTTCCPGTLAAGLASGHRGFRESRRRGVSRRPDDVLIDNRRVGHLVDRPEVAGMEQIGVVAQVSRATREHELAVAEHVSPCRHVEREMHVLLHDQYS